MNKIVKVMCSIGLISAGLGAGYAYHVIEAEKSLPAKCSASIVIFKNDLKANLSVYIAHNQQKKTGVISMMGNISQDDKPRSSVRRDIFYSWTTKHNTYDMRSIRIDKFKSIDTISDAEMEKILPDFYIYPEKHISYSFSKQRNGSYLISVGKRPLVHCAK